VKRILVTGSRSWTDYQPLLLALVNHSMPGDTLVHGNALGADRLFSLAGVSVGLVIEPHPRQSHNSPRARNQHMVDLGADLCLAAAEHWDSGTGMCARMARRAGIKVIDLGVPTGPEDRP